MNWKRLLIAVLAAALFIWFCEAAFHTSKFMQDRYAATRAMTPGLWRPHADFNLVALNLLPLLSVFLFTLIFAGVFSGSGAARGFRYGLLMGLFKSTTHVWQYIIQPLTTGIFLAYCGAAIIEFAIAGAIIGAIYKPSKV